MCIRVILPVCFLIWFFFLVSNQLTSSFIRKWMGFISNTNKMDFLQRQIEKPQNVQSHLYIEYVVDANLSKYCETPVREGRGTWRRLTNVKRLVRQRYCWVRGWRTDEEQNSTPVMTCYRCVSYLHVVCVINIRIFELVLVFLLLPSFFGPQITFPYLFVLRYPFLLYSFTFSFL